MKCPNHTTPAFLPANATLRIPEDAVVGARVGQLQAAAQPGVRYKLLTADVPFVVDELLGAIEVAGTLDFNAASRYDLQISATSDLPGAAAATAFARVEVLDVNDHAPAFDKETYSAIISDKHAEHDPLLTVQASDDDAGENRRVSYFIVDQRVKPVLRVTSSGRIFSKVPVHVLLKQAPYFFQIGARDSGTPTLEGFAQVQLLVEVC